MELPPVGLGMTTVKPEALILCLCLSVTGLCKAEVPLRVAEQLGRELTPTGAEMAGNAEGTIPRWTGKEFNLFSGELPDGRVIPVNPYADESPLSIINYVNHEEFSDKLSPGLIAMLEKYPQTYHIRVFPTHRTFSNNQKIYDAARFNALNARLEEGGNGVKGQKLAYPFPIPYGTNSEKAVQIIWNHMFRWRNGAVSRNIVQITPNSDGFFVPVKMQEKFAFREILTDFSPRKDVNIFFYFMQSVKAPARLAGDILLVHETLNQVRGARRAWLYQSGARRVRRTPAVAYDSPGTASDGLRTNDNFDMFNGSPDRYNWKLSGKKEMFIPYNNFEIGSPEYRYKDLLMPKHVRPEVLRYELHRVWVVEATLKPDKQHIYKKRVFYVDEDSWQIALVDHYDNEDKLWRVSEGFHVQHYHQNVSWLAAHAIYDLFSGRYLVNGLSNEELIAFDWNYAASSRDFTPAALRREGHR